MKYLVLIERNLVFFSSGNFQAGEPGAVLKKYDSREQKAFDKLMKDVLRSYVPEYRGDVVKNNESILSKQPELLSFFLKNETMHASLCIKKIQ